MEDGRLSIRLLGGFEVRGGGEPMRRVRTRSVEWLLALLVLRHGRDVPRSWLAGTLWPESRDAQALFNLRRNLMELRQALGPEAARLRAPDRATLGLDLTGAAVDVLAFDTAMAAGDERSLREAVALYRGPLLEGCLEEWVLPERDRRAEACLQALETLADRAAEQGDGAAALGYLSQAAALDPLRDSTQRRRMQALAAGGDLPAALLTYREHRLRLHRELNVDPDPETTHLFQQLRAGARRPPPPGARPPSNLNAGSPRHGSDLPDPDPIQNPTSKIQNSASLPRPLTALIGREEEVREVVRSVRAARLVTLVGGGGVGKTRLAIQAAGELAADFPEGVVFIELASLADPALLPAHMAVALGLLNAEPEAGPDALLRALGERLARQPALLVLDNCEHLVDAAAALVHGLLSAGPELRVLTTSRQRLGLTGEIVWRVPSLPAPDPDCLPADAAEAITAVLAYPAAQLVLERAAEARPGFRLGSQEEAIAVARICRRLEGIPLALELATARVSLLTLPQIAVRLDDRFRLLTGGSRAALPRQQTLRALIDWSYDLLPEPERALLRRLAVFAGGWNLEAAEAVCGGEGVQAFRRSGVQGPAKAGSSLASPERLNAQTPERPNADEVLDLLGALEEKSLVLVEVRDGAIRYRMLETVREYAWGRLPESGEMAAVRDRHRDWFLQLAERAAPELFGRDLRRWLDQLDQEQDNLRAALHWALEAGQGEPATRLAGALVPFWHVRRQLTEGREALGAVLALPGMANPDEPRARLLYGAGLLARMQEDRSAAHTSWTEALAIRRQINDRRGTAEVLAELGELEDQLMNRGAAAVLLEESLALWRELDDRAGQARSLRALARVATAHEALPAARAMLEEALALDRELGNPRGQLADLQGIGLLAWDQGDLPVARVALEEVLAIQRELGDRWGTAGTLFFLGRIAFDLGEYEAARELWEETLALDKEKMGEGGYVVLCLGQLLEVHGDVTRARESYGAFIEKERRAGSKTGVPGGMVALGNLALTQGDEATAWEWYQKALTLYRGLDSEIDWVRITLPYLLWRLAWRRGDRAAAQPLEEELLDLSRLLEGRPRVGWLLHYRAMMARHAGGDEQARTLHRQSAALFQELGQWKGLAASLEGQAGLAAAQGEMRRAARLSGAAAALRERAGQNRVTIDRMDHEANVAAAGAALGEAAFGVAWAEGRAVSLDQAIESALSHE